MKRLDNICHVSIAGLRSSAPLHLQLHAEGINKPHQRRAERRTTARVNPRNGSKGA